MATTDRRLGILWGGTVLAAVLFAPFAAQLVPPLPTCLFRELTGLPCPTCGTAHAAMALARMDLGTAIAFNPLAAAAALLFLVGGAVAGVKSVAGKPIAEPRLPLPVLRALVLLAVTANWAWLLLHPPPS